MFTLKITLQPRPNADGLYLVRLRITKERVHTYLSTGFAVPKKDWNPKGKAEPWPGNWLRTSHHSHKEVNQALYELLERARLMALAEPGLSRNELRERLKGKSESGDFLAYFLAETEKTEARQSRTGKRWRTVYNHLKKLRASLDFSDITHKFLREYEAFRLPEEPADSTLSRELSLILQVFELAKKDGVTALPLPEQIKLRDSRGKKAALTPEELKEFFTVELPERKGSVLELARKTYMIQFYLHGARIGDVLLLKKESVRNGRVVFDMQKTAHGKSVEIVPNLAELLRPFLKNEPYLLPWVKRDLEEKELLKRIESVTSIINRNLKKICELAGIQKNITTHTARHTFASIAADRVNNDLRTIQRLLGHKKLATTEIYIRELTTAELDRATVAIYG